MAYVMLVSQAAAVANQASATGIIFTWDAMEGESKPMVADAQASAQRHAYARDSLSQGGGPSSVVLIYVAPPRVWFMYRRFQ